MGHIIWYDSFVVSDFAPLLLDYFYFRRLNHNFIEIGIWWLIPISTLLYSTI